MRSVGVTLGSAGLWLLVGCTDPAVADVGFDAGFTPLDSSVRRDGSTTTTHDASATQEDGSTSSTPDGATRADGGSGSAEATYNAYLDAVNARLTRECTCHPTELLYADTPSCLAGEIEDSTHRACRVEAFLAHVDDFSGPYACRTPIAQERTRCYETSACTSTAFGSCDDAANTSVMSCTPTTTPAENAREASYNACLARTYVGTGADTCSDTGGVMTTGARVFSGTTLGAGAHREGSCAEHSGDAADKTFRWCAPSTATYLFDTYGSSFDTVLYVKQMCSSILEVSGSCNDDSFEEGHGTDSHLTGMINGGTCVQITVDGAKVDEAGDFVININPM